MQRLKSIKKGMTLAVMALVLSVTAGGMGLVSAQNDAQDSADRHRQPVWEEINREIVQNPAKPAPPEVMAQLISLKVTYRDFNNRQRTGIVEVNRDLKNDVIDLFKYAYYLNFPFKEVAVSSDPRFGWDDNRLMDADITSCFNYRTIAGTDRPSQHGLGRACDLNPRQNPYITLDDQGSPVTQPTGASWLLGSPGTLHRDHALIQLVESRGWAWGGRWTLQDTDGAVIDYQHIQKRAPAASASTEQEKSDKQ